MKILKLLLILSFFTFVNVLHAEVKLGMINANEIGKESVAFKNVIEKINSKAEESDKNAMKIQKEFTKKYETLGKQKNVLSADEYNKRNDALNKAVEKEEKVLYAQRATLDKAYREANEALSKKTREIIEKIAKEKGITMVFDKSTVVYSDASIDITKEVISEVNKQLKSIDINLS